MKIEVEFTWVVGMLMAIAGLWWGMAKMMLAQSQRHIDAQFEAIAKTLKQQDEGARRIERELMELKAELPRDYVRREDHTRVIAGVQVSIDNLRLTVERAITLRQTT